MASEIQTIEISFPVGVELTSTEEHAFVMLTNQVCDRWERANPDRVMWPFGIGQKMLSNPYTIGDDEPFEFDESVFQIECSERENYDWPCANCGIKQGDHKGLILDPPAGDCDYKPKESDMSEQQEREPAPIIKYFSFDHLPDDLKEASRPFCATAEWVDQNLPNCAEKSVALRKLLEAKDAAVRAALDKREAA